MIRHTALVTLLILLIGGSAAAFEPEEVGKRALLIGISNYENLKPLRGADRDVELMATVLTGRFAFEPDNVRVLRNENATYDTIMANLKLLAESTGPNDVVYVHFSGYGSQVVDQSGEELDRFDESVVPYDGRGSAPDILDDDIETFLRDIVAKTRNVTITLDVCYTTEYSRRGTQGRCIDAEYASEKQVFQSSFSEPDDKFVEARREIAILQAARRGSIANETLFDSGVYGVLTYELAHSMLNAPANATFGSVLEQVDAHVSARFPSQKVDIDLKRRDEPMLFVPDARSQFGGLVSVLDENNTVRLQGGVAQGFEVGRSVDIYAPGTRDFTTAEPIAQARIERSSDTVSMGTSSTAGPIPKGAIAVAATPDEHSTLTVWIDIDSISRRDFDALRKQLMRLDEVRIVSAESDGQLQVRRVNGGYAIASGDLVLLNEGLRSTDEVAARIYDWVGWFDFLETKNPQSRLSLSVDLGPMEGGDGPIRPGDILQLEVRNLSQAPVYITTWVLSTDGSADLLPDANKPLSPDEEYRQIFGTFLPDGKQAVTDHIKVFASAEPLRLNGNSGTVRGFESVLANTDWTTAQSSYELRRQNTRVSSFAVHLEDSSRSEPVANDEGRYTICATGAQSDCVFGDSLTEDGSIVVIDRTLGRSDLDDIEPRDAFQEAYDLGDRLGVDRVEPLFEVAFADNYSNFGARSGGTGHDEEARKDRLWSVKYVRAPEAWQYLRDNFGKVQGEEADGVRIAHLDTGYRRHPELYRERPKKTVLEEYGIDLVDGGDPFDTLVTSGLIPNPGHGTVSGSTIVSPAGCQLADSQQYEPCVSGTGPGAQLIPMRIHTSVVVLNQRRLAKAIMSVARGEIEGDPRIVSIAMGGPPSWSLWQAVKKAEKAGILIIAAAGNNVKVVVWPARFRSTIAAGAIDVRCNIWPGSSEGRRVDISAPGQSVWHGYINRTKKDPEDDIGMGNGTTFATATTTGVAALWMARHQGTADYELAVRNGTLTEAFRKAITGSAWQPVAGNPGRPDTHCPDLEKWNTRKNGAGIVNALALLEAPLDATAARSAASDTYEDLPLYTSLYPEGADPAQIAADYRGLFLRPDDTRPSIFEAEILYYYSMNETVRRAIEYTIEGNNTPEDYRRTREALLRAGVSDRLQEQLR